MSHVDRSANGRSGINRGHDARTRRGKDAEKYVKLKNDDRGKNDDRREYAQECSDGTLYTMRDR